MNPQFNYRVYYWELIISIKKFTIFLKKTVLPDTIKTTPRSEFESESFA